MDVTGEPDGPPIKSTISFSDMIAGYNAAVGILAALRARDQTGEGQVVGVNLLDSMVAVLGSLAYSYFATGEAPRRIAPDVHPFIVPAGTFSTKDGYINIAAVREKEVSSLCQALGMPELAEDLAFATNQERVKNRQRLREAIENALRARPTSEWVDLLGSHGVLADAVNTIEEAMVHPQVVHNQLKQTVEHPTAGAVSVMRTPLRIPTAPLHPGAAAAPG